MLDFNDTQRPVEPRRILDDSEREELRAGLIAGLSSVLATLFPVDDRSTATFMRLFYSQLRAGADRSTALQRTMLQMMQVATMNTPEHWAPFVLLGRDGPLALPPVDTR